MVLRMMLNNVRLPEIVGDFLKLTGALQKLVANATQGILLEVKTMLYEQESRNTYKLFGRRHMLISCSLPVARG